MTAIRVSDASMTRADWTKVRCHNILNAASREAAHAVLAKLSRAELVAVATELGVPHYARANKTAIRKAIVELTVGRRLDSLAIARNAVAR